MFLYHVYKMSNITEYLLVIRKFIARLIAINIAPLAELFCNCPFADL